MSRASTEQAQYQQEVLEFVKYPENHANRLTEEQVRTMLVSFVQFANSHELDRVLASVELTRTDLY